MVISEYPVIPSGTLKYPRNIYKHVETRIMARKIQEKYRVAIPPDMLNDAGLSVGDDVELVHRDGIIMIMSKEQFEEVLNI